MDFQRYYHVSRLLVYHFLPNLCPSSTLRNPGFCFCIISKYMTSNIRMKQSTGENYSDYLSRVRIEKAKRLLHDDQFKIQDVSERGDIQTPDTSVKCPKGIGIQVYPQRKIEILKIKHIIPKHSLSRSEASCRYDKDYKR